MTPTDLSEIRASIEQVVEAARLFRERLFPVAEAANKAAARIQATIQPVNQMKRNGRAAA